MPARRSGRSPAPPPSPEQARRAEPSFAARGITERQLEIAQEAGRILAAASDPEEAIPALLRVLHGAGEWDFARFLVYDPLAGVLRASPGWTIADERSAPLLDLVGDRDASITSGFTGLAWESGATVWVDDLAGDLGSLPAGELGLAGFTSAAYVPAMADEQPRGMLELYRRARAEREPIAVRLLDALGEQLGYFLTRMTRAAAATEGPGEIDGERVGLASLARFPGESPFPVMRVGPDGLLAYVNEPARRLLGSEVGQALPSALERSFGDVLRSGQAREVETTHGERTLLLHLVPAGHGGETNVFGVEVTSRVRAERALRESEAAITGLYRVAADPSLSLADQLRRLTNLVVARFGRGSAIISRIVPNGLEVMEANAFDPRVAPGFVFSGEHTYSWEALRRDELVAIWDAHAQPEWREHPATVTYGLRAFVGAPLRVGGRLFGSVAWSSPFARPRPFRPADLDYVRLVAEWIGTAIERDEATRALAAANEGLEAAAERAVALANRAETASRSKSLFLATMSHEIRTPLHGLLGMVQVLEGMPLDAEQIRAVGLIRGSGDQLMAIIDDVLDLANVESGQMELRDRPFQLARVLEEAVAPFGQGARGKGLDVAVHVDPAAAGTLLGDPGRLRQVVSKLVSNAVKFTASGWVRISATTAPSTGTLRIAVADSGIGIDPAEHERIFEPFTQTDASMQRLHQGGGLGLAIASRLAGLMGGSIDVDSAPGAGSTFTLRLPLRMAAADAVVADVAPAGDAGPRTVLVVEDTPLSREIAIRFLQRDGHEVLVAMDGREALDILADHEVDIVLMDCQMPGMDGYETTRIIRERELDARLVRLPIVAVTANAFADDRARAFESGMDGFLPKPYRADDLLAFVRRFAANPGERVVRPRLAAEAGSHWQRSAPQEHSPGETMPPASGGLPAVPVPLPAGLSELAALGVPSSTIGEILRAFVVDGDHLMSDMREGLDGWNRQAVQEAARSLAEPAATIGLDALVAACRSLAAAGEPDLRPRVALVEGTYREAAQRARAIAAVLPVA